MGVVAFYVIAHQDDWQLFRGQQAWIDIDSGSRIVFVYLTAGDGGGPLVSGWWEARELGALESCRLVTGPRPFLRWVRWLNGHPIAGCECGNTASYFLRFPDGSLEGVRRSNSPIRTVDGSSNYSGWDDVCATLKAILDCERTGAGTEHPWVNSHEYDRQLNPNDNPDHTATGEAVRAVTSGVYNRVWWVGYDVANRAPNLSAEETGRKRRLQRAYTDRILRETTQSGTRIDDWANNGRIYESWLDRSYVRGEPA
jgi:GlcNAc-PI de-N-acetylase